MKKIEKKVEELKNEIWIITAEEALDNLKIKLENKIFIYKLLLFLIPTASLLTIFYILNMKYLVIGGLVYSAIHCVKEMIKNDPGFYINVPKLSNEDLDYDKIEEELNKSKKNELKEELTKISIVDDINLTQDILVEQIKKELDILYSIYEIPPFTVTDDELNILINNISIDFNNEDFYNVCIYLIRITLAKSIKENKKKIKIDDLIDNLYYIYGLDKSPKEYFDLKKQIKEDIKEIKLLNKTKKLTKKP